jgi:hypothetical protein
MASQAMYIENTTTAGKEKWMILAARRSRLKPVARST